jgi:hypothetical protein
MIFREVLAAGGVPRNESTVGMWLATRLDPPVLDRP